LQEFLAERTPSCKNDYLEIFRPDDTANIDVFIYEWFAMIELQFPGTEVCRRGRLCGWRERWCGWRDRWCGWRGRLWGFYWFLNFIARSQKHQHCSGPNYAERAKKVI